MTLLFMDGFDHYDGSQTLDKYDAGGGQTVSTGYGRFGSGGIRMYGPGNTIRKNIGVNKTTLYAGFALYKESTTTPFSTLHGILKFMDESNVAQVNLTINGSFGFTVWNGDGTSLGTSADGIITNQKWYYIEMKATISATVGVVEVKLNGTQVINLTSQDTKNGTDYIRNVELAGLNPNQYSWIDDFYIDDAEFHGDCRIRAFTPDSVSSTNNSFTASAGNKDDCVDDQPSNEDTEYITSDTLNHKQGFGITTGSLGTVIGIQLNNHCRVDEAGTRKITPLIRSNSTDYSGTETDTIAADYNFESEIWELDPDDSNAWTQTKLEAAEFGLEITT